MTNSAPSPAVDFLRCDPTIPMRAVEAMADRLVRMAQVSRALAEAQRPVDLQGLDGMVGRLCAQTLDLEPAEGQAMRPRLVAVLAEIDLLEEMLTRPRVAED